MLHREPIHAATAADVTLGSDEIRLRELRSN
jgi:hypothetical protein